MRPHHELFPLSCIDRSQIGKGQDERKEERNHDQPKGRTDCRGFLYQGERGRCLSGELHFFNTASGPILRCRGWSLAGTPCTLIKACRGSVVPGGLRSTNRTGGGNSASGPGGPGTLPSRDNGTQDPPPINDWTAQVQALAANPAWVQEQFAQWQLFHQQYQHLQCQQQLVAASTTDPWQVLPENAGSTGDWWSMDTGTDRIGVQSPNPTPRQG